jgi:curved DNA-binding protein CbpA
MTNDGRDPYLTLGVSPTASDADVRAAYRRLVKLHHPDHNGGSEESERRFEEVQAAYAQIRDLRKAGPRAAQAQGVPHRARTSAPPPPRARTSAPPPPRAPVDPEVEARMANLERELREAQDARERARRAAREAASPSSQRPTDEELGYVTTDDSFSKILADARSELSGRLAGAKEHPVAQRVTDLIDELEDLVSKGIRDRRG